ncbi:MAG: hypothetical protein ND895_29075 [Pyrinomonadaceae bacterium]|nr:hypothetical protein [Pyrinomonadaceae bacterium]
MRRTTLLKIVAALALAVAACAPAQAACASGQFTKSIVSYYSTSYPLPPFAQRDETAESICDVIHSESGQRICQIKLWGALYRPASGGIFAQFPALIFNHGSGDEFTDDTKYCELGKYFAERGYLVLIPFRRGQGDPPNHQSSGVYIEDLVTDFGNNPSHHDTTCTTTACYRAEILRLQSDQEVVYALNHLKLTDRMKKDRDGEHIFGVGGNSYGGSVTVFFNRKDHGQRAAIAFAAAAQGWGQVNFAYAAQDWELSQDRRTLLGALLTAAKNAKHPAFYLQARWDYDTRSTIDLAYAHAYGSDDPTHGHRFMASIFPYKKFFLDNGDVDYQSAHVGFIGDPERWGPSVLAFLKLYGVN